MELVQCGRTRCSSIAVHTSASLVCCWESCSFVALQFGTRRKFPSKQSEDERQLCSHLCLHITGGSYTGQLCAGHLPLFMNSEFSLRHDTDRPSIPVPRYPQDLRRLPRPWRQVCRQPPSWAGVRRSQAQLSYAHRVCAPVFNFPRAYAPSKPFPATLIVLCGHIYTHASPSFPRGASACA